jgi:Acetyltransferase (GNAT) domain
MLEHHAQRDGEDPAAYSVQVARTFQELRQLAPECLAPLAGGDFFGTGSWFDLLAAHGTDKQAALLLILVREVAGSGRCHVLPMQHQRRGQNAAYGPVLLSLSNYYSSLYGPIGSPSELTVGALRAALRHLRRSRGASGVVNFQPLDAEGPFYERMKQALTLEGYWVETYNCFGNWHLAVNERSFAAYEVSLPSRLRNTIKRNRKKLTAAGAWSIDVIDQPGPALERGVVAWQEIYDKSWKVPEPFPDFVPGLIRMCAQKGWLRLGILWLGEIPIAAQLWIIKDRQALIYKLAYDEAYKRFSAGSTLSAELMRRALDDDHVLDVDYLTGDDGYKVDWMSHRRQRIGLVAFDARSLQGIVSFTKQRLGSVWRRWSGREAAQAQNASLSASRPNALTIEQEIDPKA